MTDKITALMASVLGLLNATAVKRGGYAAVVLDQESRSRLLTWWEAEVGLPLLAVTHAHHVTLKFNPSAEELGEIPIGEEARLRVTGWAADDKGQAVAVKPSVPTLKSMPHVTVSVARGVRPVYSNELLSGLVNADGPVLTGTVQYVLPGR